MKKKKSLLLVKTRVKGDVKGLSEFLSVISNVKGAELVDMLVNRISSDKYKVTAFLSVAGISINKVVEVLKGCRCVEELDYVSRDFGALFNKFLYPLRIGEEDRVVVLRSETLKGFIEGLRRRVGTSAANVFLFHLGFSGGYMIAKHAKEKSRAFSAREVLDAVLAFHQACGLGRFEIVEYDPVRPHVVIRAYDLIECQGVPSTRPRSALYRGMLAGTLLQIFDKDMEVTETRCVAMGNLYCEFYATPVGEVSAEKPK